MRGERGCKLMRPDAMGLETGRGLAAIEALPSAWMRRLRELSPAVRSLRGAPFWRAVRDLPPTPLSPFPVSLLGKPRPLR